MSAPGAWRSPRPSSTTAVVLAAIAYLAIGRFFPNAGPHVQMLRLAAWALSGIVFVAHIAHERVARGSSNALMAKRVTLAVAIAALGLAIAGPLYARWVAGRPIPPVLPALVLWPLETAVPAYLVARVIGPVVRRRNPQSQSRTSGM